eukprot:SAG31_NODE_4385_length_3281_cov_137.482401_7_plen_59_part_00
MMTLKSLHLARFYEINKLRLLLLTVGSSLFGLSGVALGVLLDKCGPRWGATLGGEDLI